MAIKFVALKNDAQAVFALEILKELGQETMAIDTAVDDDSQISNFPPENILVGLFTAPDPKLLRHSHLSRTASHRTMGSAPIWASGCHLLIAIREEFHKKKSRPDEMCREWIKIANNLTTIEWAKSAPWGSLPTAPSNFQLYQKWIATHLGQDPEKLGVRFVVPKNNLTTEETKEIRQKLRQKKDKRLTDRVIRLAQKTSHKLGIESIIKTGVKLIDLAKERRLGIESGLEFEMILNCLWRTLAGDQLLIIAPLCPAWTYNEDGYTFSGLEENSRGIFYEKMIREFVYFVDFLKKFDFDIEYELLAWIADIEWFSMTDCSNVSAKEKFMETVRKQCEMIRNDLECRRINGRVTPLLKVATEADYLAEAATQRSAYTQLLETSATTQKHFQNTLKIKQNSYQKRFGVPVTPYNPHSKIKEGLTKDIIAHLAPLAIFKKLYSGSNFMFFLEAEPFTQLYHDVPYISWHGQSGANYDPRRVPEFQSPFGQNRTGQF